MGHVCDPGGTDPGIRGTGEEQELVELVRRDIDRDPAMGVAAKEPVRTQRPVQPTRTETGRMDHPSDRSGGDQLPRARRRPHLEPLGEIDREDPPGLRLHPSDGIEDGHEIVFQTEGPRSQYRCFLRTFAEGGAPHVPVASGADLPCD